MKHRLRWWALALAFTTCLAPAEADESPTALERQAVRPLDGSPHEIVEGVYTLGALPPMSAYLVQAADGLVLIDTGYASQLGRLIEAISTLGLDPNDIRHVLVTHLHLDHWMSMDAVRKATGALTYMGLEDAEIVERGIHPDVAFPARRAPHDLLIPPTTVDYKISTEERLPIPGIDLRAIGCAGHTPGSTCYYLTTGPWRILFGGDTIMTVRSGLGTYMTELHPELGGDITAYRSTLSRLSELPVNMILPGHPVYDRLEQGTDPHPVVSASGWDSLLARGIDELDQVESRLARDGSDFLDGTPKEVAPGVFYLGLHNGEAAYAVESEEGLCLIDPDRMGPKIVDRLKALGLDPARVRSWLFTHPPRDLSGLALALPSLPREIHGPRGSSAPALSLGVDFVAVPERGRIACCGKSIEVFPLDAWHSGDVGYFFWVQGQSVAVTGDALSPLTADDTIVLEPQDASPTSPNDKHRLFAPLEGLQVSVWLPARPFAAQNANLYDDAWWRLVRVNRLVLATGKRPTS